MSICREVYKAIRHECIERGLDPDAIRRNNANDMRVASGRCLVKVRAYKPTGVALGSPVPRSQYQHALLKLAEAAEKKITEITASKRALAYVPETYYHVTLVNRDHFDHRLDGSAVTRLGLRELRRITGVIQDMCLESVTVKFKGWQLTRSGRLLVTGFPEDGSLFQLRSRLLEELPELGANPPSAAHLKIGHVLTCLNRPQLREFHAWMDSVSSSIDHTLVFEDVFTPLGRVRLTL